ncbi:MAG: M56 family metallopeptidase [Thermoguttaceae bacterium]
MRRGLRLIWRPSGNWVVAIELAALAAVCALPFWPRISLLGTASQKSVVKLPVAVDHDPMTMPAAMPRTTLPRMPRPVPAFDIPPNRDDDESAAPPVSAHSPPPGWSWIELATGAYLFSAMLVVAWLVWGAAAAIRACRQAEDAPESLREELTRIVGDGRAVPRLLVSSRVTTAVALGLRRPTIVLPVGLLEDGPPQALRAVLMHEWAHIRNGDLWLLALGRFLLVLLFPHPLFWWLRRAIRGDQELLADAAAAGDNRPAYAEELLRLVRKTAYRSPMAASVAVGIWESSSQLSRRIAMLLDEDFRVEPRVPRRWRHRVLGLLAISGAVCSLVTLQPGPSAGQAAQANGPAAAASSSHPSLAAESSEKGASAITEPIVLPVYRLFPLGEPAACKELALTAEQIQKLRAIHDKYNADASNLANAKSRLLQERMKEIVKQVEEILTPEQMQSLKEIVFRELTYSCLSDPKDLERLSLTQEQNGKLLSLRQEVDDWFQRNDQEMIDKALSVLTSQQQALFREETLGPLGPDDQLIPLAVNVKGETKPIYVYSLDPYPDFTQPSVRKELGLSATQEQQVRDILGSSANLAERLARELEKLPPQERERNLPLLASISSEVRSHRAESREERYDFAEKMIEARKKQRARFAEHPMMKASVELRKQFEAMLTPKQLALYRDMAVRRFAARARHDSLMLRMVGASEQQVADIKRVYDDHIAKGAQFVREAGQRLLKILTPPQQEALRAEFEKEIGKIEATLSSGMDQATEGDLLGPVKISGGSLALVGRPAVKSAPAGKAGKVSAEASVASTAPAPMEKWDPSFQLPVYFELWQPELRKRLGIEFSAEQRKKLREISADCARKRRELLKDGPKTTDQVQEAKFTETWDQAIKDYRRQVETVLTPQQLQTYQELTLNKEASRLLRQPEARKSIGITITRQQQEELDRVDRETSEKYTQECEHAIRAVLAALNPQQREQLRLEVEQRILADEEGFWLRASQTGAIKAVDGDVIFEWVPPEMKNANLVREEGELQDETIAKRVGLATEQRKQLSALDAEHQRKTQQLVLEVLKLSPEQRRRPEVREKAARMRNETRQRTVALLTPQQWAALKDIDFGGGAFTILRGIIFPETTFDKVTDPKVQKKIALSDQQMAALRRIYEDFEIDQNRIGQELDRKTFDVLTPQQQDKIREYLVKTRGW